MDPRQSNDHDNQQRDRDIKAEAIAEGTTPERAKHHRSPTAQRSTRASQQQWHAAPGQVGPGRLQDGYSENEGSEYSNAEPGPDQENYDPTHSGVRHAQRKPGTRPNTPGREGNTGWAEQLQMGHTTDTERKNPAD